MFSAYGQAYRTLIDTLVFKFRFGKLGMRGGCGVNYKGLDIGHIGKE